MQWKFFPKDAIMGSCESPSNCNVDSLCYYLEYIPNVSGTLTSYTTGFFVDCLGGSNIIVENSSCVMVDNSDIQNFCSEVDIVLLNCSGNNGNVTITDGVPVNLHMICFDISSSEMVAMIEDDITDLTLSVDPVGGGSEVSEFPSYNTFVVDYDRDCSMFCTDMISCSRDIGSSGDIVFSNLPSGHIVNGVSTANSSVNTQNFDIYDELSFNCGSAGGLDDISYSFSILNTQDVNANGLIDSFAGENHHLIQTIDGIAGAIPIGIDNESESSSGDIRGYKIKVEFASHIKISAHQLSINLKGINTNNAAFESAALLIYNDLNVPYGSVTYNGYYNGEADLSGNCNTTVVMNQPWDSTGTGVFLAQSRMTMDLTDPCLPIASVINGAFDTISVEAVSDCGLNPNDRVGGFELIVFYEDVSASSVLDDGSGNEPDEGVTGNALTQVNTTSVSTFAGYEITGCVFEYILPIELSSFEAIIKENRTYIGWETTSEFGNDYFSIEWSSDGSNFKSIGEQAGLGNSNRLQIYQFIHNDPRFGVNYYRLKQVDFDGSYSYSEIRSVWYQNTQKRELIVYPNPTRSIINIKHNFGIQHENLEILIYDLLGNKYKTTIQNLGNDEISVSTKELNSGQYIIQITIGNEVQYVRIVKT